MPKIIPNLPITGIASFAKYPICTDLDQLDDADVCVMGIPYDMGAPYLSGTKFGPAESARSPAITDEEMPVSGILRE